ncbi:hypothetical protein GQ600_22902 [Phytophthora cactorum]|nr:hypothetical protein GQ600_22902 [Phytophthora cactorum]
MAGFPGSVRCSYSCGIAARDSMVAHEARRPTVQNADAACILYYKLSNKTVTWRRCDWCSVSVLSKSWRHHGGLCGEKVRVLARKSCHLATAPSMAARSCRTLVKWLKRKWAEYNSDMRATGNLELPVVEPPGLALMLEYWASSSGMNGQTLADNEEDTNTAEMEATLPVVRGGGDWPTITAQSKTLGMKSMADSFQAMAAAMTTTAPHSATGDIVSAIDQRFEAMMQS